MRLTNKVKDRIGKRLVGTTKGHLFYCGWRTRSPMVYIDNKRYCVARILWEIAVGRLSDTDRLVKTCKEPGCVCPGHYQRYTMKQFYRLLQTNNTRKK